MLDKRGNPNSAERIAPVERFVRLFRKDRIECLVADREFAGDKWMPYLNDSCIRYHIRISNNFKVWQPSKDREVKASHLFNGLKIGRYRHYDKIVSINGQLCYLSGCRLQKGDFLSIASFNRPQEAQRDYGDRWQIEVFQGHEVQRVRHRGDPPDRPGKVGETGTVGNGGVRLVLQGGHIFGQGQAEFRVVRPIGPLELVFQILV